jgi:parvulin-like peptidyl-prolyl isomerase
LLVHFCSRASRHLAPIRRGAYAKEQEEMLLALKSGEVSKVIEQPSVFLIFKLDKRNTPELADVKDEIQKKLSQDKLEQLTTSAAATLAWITTKTTLVRRRARAVP